MNRNYANRAYRRNRVGYSEKRWSIKFWPTFWLILLTSLLVTYCTYDDDEFKQKLEIKYGPYPDTEVPSED